MAKKSVIDTKECYGCGVCAIACPKQIIRIEHDNSGFYAPIISNPDACIECGVCLDVCAYQDDQIPAPSTVINGYAAWINDNSKRHECSSGGIGFAIAEHLIHDGYKACGVRYNASEQRAEHFMAATVEDYLPSIGSKYIQSYTLPGFSALNKTDKFLVCGTPCQIDSLRRYIQKVKIEDNFVLLDFYCHGVPSALMWKKYVAEKQSKHKVPAPIFSWRSKANGWHESWVMNIPSNSTDDYLFFSSSKKGDLFYKFFLGHHCLGKACHDKCKYKMDASAADIRIGDLWGSQYEQNEEGVSALLTLTKKGADIISDLTSCSLQPLPAEIVMQGQMREPAKRSLVYNYIMRRLQGNSSLKSILLSSKIIKRVNRIILKFR